MLRRSTSNNLKKSINNSQKLLSSDVIRISPDIIAALNKMNPELVPMFKLYLQEQLEGDYMNLWLSIDSFKHDSQGKHRHHSELESMAQDIYEKYWSPSSGHQVVIKLRYTLLCNVLLSSFL